MLIQLEEQLNHFFQYNQFRPGQKNIIEDVMKGRDVLAMLPTGTGKSICYQLPALLSSGMTIIVSPLLSLMEDQVQQLKSIGIKNVVALNSFLPFHERKQVMRELSRYKMVYVSPEILQSPALMQVLQMQRISLFVVDEAHCISQWGHEFRTDYLKLAQVRQALGSPPCLALTATATKEAQQDILVHLQMTNPVKHIHSVDRQNIAIMVKRVANIDEKLDGLVSLVKNLQGPTMIYVATRMWAQRLAGLLEEKTTSRVAYYHGGIETEDRILIQQQFINGQLDIVCCTNAFGMGINKADVRVVIHFHYPMQMESYIQEIGRAGRDGNGSLAVVLHAEEDNSLQDFLLTQELPSELQVKAIINELALLEQSKPLLTREIEEELFIRSGISETVWRFLKFHLEQREYITGNAISLEHAKEHILEDLNRVIHGRLAVKQKKLHQMERWISDTDCRRQAYMHVFGETLTNPPRLCCDNCGLDETVFYNSDKPQAERVSWRAQLKRLLHQ